MADQAHSLSPIDPGDLDGGSSSSSLVIDCDSCQVRPQACGDCVVSVLLGQPNPEWEPEEQRAMAVLAESGLVPRLRLVTDGGSSEPPNPG